METRELIQAAASIAGGIAGTTAADKGALTPEVIAKIARESVDIARAIEKVSRERPERPERFERPERLERPDRPV
jgi:hypothetical protein